MLYIAGYVVLLSILIYGLLGISGTIKKTILTLLFISVAFSGPIIYYDAMSRAKDVKYEFFENPKEAAVLGHYTIPNKALLVLLLWGNNTEPRLYKYNWSKEVQKLAEELQEAQRNKQQMILELPFERSYEKDKPLRLHPIPQLKMPDKEAPQPKGKEYNL